MRRRERPGALARCLLPFFLLLAPAAVAAQGTAQGIETGSGAFDQPLGATWNDRTMRVYYHKPKNFGPESPILFVMHGVNRDADRYRDGWVDLSEQYGYLIVAPEFSKEIFPRSWKYNFGNVVTSSGGALTPNPQEAWSFFVIDRVFEQVRAATGSRRTTFSIFGHSAGSQFVHRYMTFTGGPNVDVAIAANAGWYMLPIDTEDFPYGLGRSNLTSADVKTVFSRRVIVLLGEADTDPNARNLRNSPETLRQGPHRLARGHTYYETARREAATLGVPLNWRLATVPGVAHSGAKMAPAAADILKEELNALARR